MISIQKKVQCCGCQSCKQACPCDCIEMQSDEEGFLYPEVEQEKCIGCNLCNKVCPMEAATLSKATESKNTPGAFGGWYKDEEIRRESSSGGAFTLFAEAIIKNGGKVFGCTLDSDMKAVHIGVDNIKDLSALRGSKYVQSDIAETYNEVKDTLKMGRQVLFVGTPCQAAGLYSFMGNVPNENLYIVDFICHGVPSPKVFADYIKAEERKKGSKLIAYRFRNKDRGWNQLGVQLGSGTLSEYADGTDIRKYPAFKDKYMNAFLDDVCLRPSCYECSFKNIPKIYADLTIADFWGVDKVTAGLNDKKGTSLILVNTDRGMTLWDKVKDSFEYKEVVFEDAIKRNPSLVKSAELLPRRESFFADYQSKGYEYVEKKYMSAITWGWHKALHILNSSGLGQFVKFGIVGCTNVIINLVVYYLCLYLGGHYLVAYTLGFLASVCNAFFWNNKYVFKNKQEKNLFRAFIKVLASYGVSFFTSVVLMSIMVELLNISSIIAPLLKMVITVPLNFVLNKVWAFKDKKVQSRAE